MCQPWETNEKSLFDDTIIFLDQVKLKIKWLGVYYLQNDKMKQNNETPLNNFFGGIRMLATEIVSYRNYILLVSN